MENAGLILFIISMGFITAAILSSVIQPNTNGPTDFKVPFESPIKLILLFIYCMFAGPYLLARNALRAFAQNAMSLLLLAGSFVTAIIWSLCSGIFIVQLLMLVGIIVV